MSINDAGRETIILVGFFYFYFTFLDKVERMYDTLGFFGMVSIYCYHY